MRCNVVWGIFVPSIVSHAKQKFRLTCVGILPRSSLHAHSPHPYDAMRWLWSGVNLYNRQINQFIMLIALIIYLIGCYAAGVVYFGTYETEREMRFYNPKEYRPIWGIACSWLAFVLILLVEYCSPPRETFKYKNVLTWWPGNWFPTQRHFTVEWRKTWPVIAILVLFYTIIWLVPEFAIPKTTAALLVTIPVLTGMICDWGVMPNKVLLIICGIIGFLLLSGKLEAQGTSLEWWCDNEQWNEWAYNREVTTPWDPINMCGPEWPDTIKPTYVLIPAVDTTLLNWEPEARIVPYHAPDRTTQPLPHVGPYFAALAEWDLLVGETNMHVSTLEFPLVIAYDGDGVEYSFVWGLKNEWFCGGAGNYLTYQYYRGKTPQDVVEALECELFQPWE